MAHAFTTFIRETEAGGPHEFQSRLGYKIRSGQHTHTHKHTHERGRKRVKETEKQRYRQTDRDKDRRRDRRIGREE